MIASEGGEVGLAARIALLRAGASAMDAVEAAVRVVEANEADHHVGVGGLPDLLGEVELDASIMDGATRRCGAVAAVTGFPHPISIARAVCDRLPEHLLPGPVLRALAARAGPEACAQAIAETLELPDEFRVTLQALCLTPDGRHGGASTRAGASYSVMRADDQSFRTEERRQV